MDLFMQLDRIDPELTGERIVMIRYRTRFHRDIIYSKLSTNPSMSLDDIATAISINTPREFLPQPWPPLSLNDIVSLSSVALIKMKAIENVGVHLPEVHASLLTDLISHRFPERLSMPTTSNAITSCEVRITHDGDVTCSYEFAEGPLSGDDGLSELANARRYAKAMLILGMQQYLESLQ